MVGQICGKCGLALSSGGCGCRPDDAETAVLPVIGGPELVRPYVHPADASGPVDPAEAANEPLLPAARYLPATARLPEQRNALPVLRGTAPPPAVRHRALPRAAGRRRRRGLLIAAGTLAVAGLGTVAAALPHMFNGGATDQSLPAPGVTVAMASSGPDSGTPAPATTAATSQSAAASTAATRRAAAARTSAGVRPTPSASHTPSPSSSSSRPSTSATPSSTPSASAAASAAVATASTTLQLGDTGAAVATLQSQLRALWVDSSLTSDGIYDARTEHDVATFQIWFNVQGDPSGVYGPNSQAKMAQQMQAQ
ncbi:putative peptidoglycan binding protein [Streptomyces sp. 846.5]|nr:peptidoglycan-binding domain-containing protein [Streptomyces sp. 846.5]TDT95436.1 putative peptidoglycan binding protein [Streptomyces sp. 846.5]